MDRIGIGDIGKREGFFRGLMLYMVVFMFVIFKVLFVYVVKINELKEVFVFVVILVLLSNVF